MSLPGAIAVVTPYPFTAPAPLVGAPRKAAPKKAAPKKAAPKKKHKK